MYTVESTVTVEGKAPQVICCQYCGKEFLYFMRQRGSASTPEVLLGLGLGQAEREAEKAARRQLESRLHPNQFNAVPCRHCFRFQSYMRRQAARDKFGPKPATGAALIVTGIVLTAIGGVTAALSDANLVVGLLMAGGGVVTVLLGGATEQRRRHRMATYDPNNEHEDDRATLARERCMTWAEFNHKQARRIAKQYSEHDAEQKRERWLNNAALREPPPPARVWLSPQAFVEGLSVPLELDNGNEVALTIPPGTEPGTVIELVPGEHNELPFRVVLLSILVRPPVKTNYYSESP